jgi:hypothetical protein
LRLPPELAAATLIERRLAVRREAATSGMVDSSEQQSSSARTFSITSAPAWPRIYAAAHRAGSGTRIVDDQSRRPRLPSHAGLRQATPVATVAAEYGVRPAALRQVVGNPGSLEPDLELTFDAHDTNYVALTVLAGQLSAGEPRLPACPDAGGRPPWGRGATPPDSGAANTRTRPSRDCASFSY